MHRELSGAAALIVAAAEEALLLAFRAELDETRPPTIPRETTTRADEEER